jgi:hypothetical protein
MCWSPRASRRSAARGKRKPKVYARNQATSLRLPDSYLEDSEDISEFCAVHRVALTLLRGVTLRSGDVVASNGSVTLWRTPLLEGADTFDAAEIFVSLVGPSIAIWCALDSLLRDNQIGQ